MAKDDRTYPLLWVEKYRRPSTLAGSGTDDKKRRMATEYGVMLRAEFVPPSKKPGDANNPYRDLYFKVLPRGVSDVPGMLLGFLSGTWYLYMVRWGGMEPWLGIDHLRFGIIGCAVNLVTMIVVSLATEEPDEATQKMVDEVRIPKGETVLAASH